MSELEEELRRRLTRVRASSKFFSGLALGALLASTLVTSCSDNDHPLEVGGNAGTSRSGAAGEAGSGDEGGRGGQSTANGGSPSKGGSSGSVGGSGAGAPSGTSGAGGSNAGSGGNGTGGSNAASGTGGSSALGGAGHAGSGGGGGLGGSNAGASGRGGSGGTSGVGGSSGGASGFGASGGTSGGGAGVGGGGASGGMSGGAGGGTSSGGIAGVAGTSGSSGTAGGGGASSGGGGASSGGGGTDGGGTGGGTGGAGGTSGGAGGAPGCPNEPLCSTPYSAENCGPTCQAITSTQCLACEATACNVGYACSDLKTNAQGGSAAGTPRSALCNEALSCLRTTGCSLIPDDSDPDVVIAQCYCGSVPYASCTSANAAGPCKLAFERSLETSDKTVMLNNLFEIAKFGGAQAYNRASCDAYACQNKGCFVGQ